MLETLISIIQTLAWIALFSAVWTLVVAPLAVFLGQFIKWGER